MSLELVPNPDIPTARVDGVRIEYNPEFFESMTDPQRMGVLAHEVMHPALGHLFRREGRDPQRWNEAADYALNPLLLDAGLKLPSGVLVDSQYKGMTAEQIFSKLQCQPPQPQFGQGTPQDGSGSGGQGEGQPGSTNSSGATGTSKKRAKPGSGCPTGDFVDPPPGATGEDGTRTMDEHDWQVAMEQAAQAAKAAGRMPGSLMEVVANNRKPTVDWKGVLQQFVAQTVVTSQSWIRPNRRYVGRGMYLPGDLKENTGEIAVVIDTSGSISTKMLEEFVAEINEILTTIHPEKLHVINCDTKVTSHQEYTGYDSEVSLTVKGRGGTMFSPAFRWIEKKDINPTCLIYLTDLDNSDGKPKQPEYPVLWVTPGHITENPPFGEVVRIAAH
jgi:predicted metal-dependent peptidase